MWGSRVVVPPQGRTAILQELHEGHLGMTKTKSLTRMYVWWPSIDNDIERSVQECVHCQHQSPDPPCAPLQPWNLEVAITTLGKVTHGFRRSI